VVPVEVRITMKPTCRPNSRLNKKQLKRVRLTLYGRKKVSGSMDQQALPSQTVNPLPNTLVLFRNITELPLSNYIDGTVNGNISAIIKSGVCQDDIELLQAWADINQQYAEAIGDHEQKLFLSLYKEVNKLAIVIDEVAKLVSLLEKYYVKEFADILNNILGTTFKFEVKDPESYDKDLKRCLTRSKGYKVQLDLKASQLKAIQERQRPGVGPTHEYYQSVLITLSDHAGYRVDNSITVFEFCDRIKRLNKQLEEAKK
jgi:hypothetical protein